LAGTEHDAAQWQAALNLNSPALTITPALIPGSTQVYSVSLDLAAAGVPAPPTLAPGHYWISIARKGEIAFGGSGLTTSFWMTSPEVVDSLPVYRRSISLFSLGRLEKLEQSPSLALRMETTVGCDSTIPGIAISGISLPAELPASYPLFELPVPVTVTATCAAFPKGQTEVSGTVCAQTNDPANPVIPVFAKAVAQ